MHMTGKEKLQHFGGEVNRRSVRKKLRPPYRQKGYNYE